MWYPKELLQAYHQTPRLWSGPLRTTHNFHVPVVQCRATRFSQVPSISTHNIRTSQFEIFQNHRSSAKESWGGQNLSFWADSRPRSTSMKRSQGKRKAESSRSSTKCGCGLGECRWVMSKQCTVLYIVARRCNITSNTWNNAAYLKRKT